MSMVCPQCQGTGDTIQGSYGQTPSGVDQEMNFNGPNVPTVNFVSCTGCGGTGQYRSFGSSGGSA
jgi:hypothetical protein